MPDDDALLPAFLADPLGPTARRAYVAWLQERGRRGEYLRSLMDELDEPASPSPVGPLRERLRQLRREIATDWAVRVDARRLATNGVYQSMPTAEGSSYLRFYTDGTVVSLSSTETPEQVWQRLSTATDRSDFSRCTYTLQADELRFRLPYQPPEPVWREWQARKAKLVESHQPSPYVLQELEELRQAPQDRYMAQQIERLEACLDVRGYQVSLEESMKYLHYAGAVGPRTICLKWYSDFTDTYSGVTTYALAFATVTADSW
jgi:hypothetical protein